jgi:uncharacterized protein DUF3455
MTKHLFAVAASFAGACAAAPDTSSIDQDLSQQACPSNTPAVLAPAADQDLAFVLHATGVQIYQCSSAGAWVFVAPDAQLYAGQDVGIGEPLGHHFAGPTWEWYPDGSTVVGKKVASATVDPSSIPWLLLVAASHGSAIGRMTDITSIQRLNTVGGNAPAGTCTPGDVANVPYTADYYFYRTAQGNEHTTRCGA